MKRLLKNTIAVWLFLMIAISAQDEVGSFEFDGLLREYEVYLPHNYELEYAIGY